MKNVLADWLGRQGVIIRTEEKDATYRVHLILESLGSTQRTRMFGMPPTRGGFLPIATPELALYKRIRRQGYVRFYLDIFERESGRLIRSTEPKIGSLTKTAYTVFFFVRWLEIDMDLPPPIFD